MPLVQSDPNAETVGVKPAVAWTAVFIFLAAVIVCVLDKLVVGDDVPDAVWLTLFAAVLPAAGVGAVAPAALQRRR